MKSLLIGVMVSLLMIGASFAAGQETLKREKSQADGRTELKLPAHFKVMQQAMMRQHMDTVSEITAALASNDLSRAADLAQSGLSRSETEKERCSMIEKMTGDKNFVQSGKAMQHKADELAGAAREGNRDKAFTALAGLLAACNDCHKRFFVTAYLGAPQEAVTINCNTCHKGFRR